MPKKKRGAVGTKRKGARRAPLAAIDRNAPASLAADARATVGDALAVWEWKHHALARDTFAHAPGTPFARTSPRRHSSPRPRSRPRS